MEWSAAQLAAVVATAAPAAVVPVLGIPALAHRTLPERITGALVRTSLYVSLASLAVCAGIVSWGGDALVVELGTWFEAGSYRFAPRLVLDVLSLPFALFAVALCGVVGSFAHRYLHRETGHHRFFVLLAVFAAGMLLVILAGNLELAFIGWELIGLSSALLVAFFHDRPQPVANAVRVFAIYRIGDVALLSAAVLVHHGQGGDTLPALLLLVAAMAKCALVPFSGWLPRAMEGPTPSSAIFYGALSVHAGAYLLLRWNPLFDDAPLAAAATVAVGAMTAVYATVVARAQTDIKSALAFASLTQVGVIVVEIGLGLQFLALVHIVAHACLRSLQFLRAPSILHDVHEARNAVGAHPDGSPAGPLLVGGEARRRLYRAALERGFLDAWLDARIVSPLSRVFRRLDAIERRWCAFVAGRSEES